MWPFRRKQKISSKELAKLIAVTTIETDDNRLALFGRISKLSLDRQLMEDNLLRITTQEIAIRQYFETKNVAYDHLIVSYHFECARELILHKAVRNYNIYKRIYNVRFHGYLDAYVKDIEGNPFSLGRQVCHYFKVLDTDAANYVPAEHLFMTFLNAANEFLNGIMSNSYDLDENSRLVLDLDKYRRISGKL